MGESVRRVRVTRRPSLFGYQALARVVAAKPIRLTQSTSKVTLFCQHTWSTMGQLRESKWQLLSRED